MRRHHADHRPEVLWEGSGWVPDRTYWCIFFAFLAQGKILELYLVLNFPVSLRWAGGVLATF